MKVRYLRGLALLAVVAVVFSGASALAAPKAPAVNLTFKNGPDSQFNIAGGTRFVPEDAYEQAQVLQWMFFEQYDHEPNIAVARFWLMYSGNPAKYADELPALQEGGYKALGAMEGRLATREYLVGERLSIADIALYGYTHVAGEGGFDLERFPAVQRWLALVASEPGHIPIDA